HRRHTGDELHDAEATVRRPLPPTQVDAPRVQRPAVDAVRAGPLCEADPAGLRTLEQGSGLVLASDLALCHEHLPSPDHPRGRPWRPGWGGGPRWTWPRGPARGTRERCPGR